MDMQRLRQNVFVEGQPLLTVSRGMAWGLHWMCRREAEIRIWPGGPRMRLKPRLTAHGSTSLFMKRIGYEPHLRFLTDLTRPGMVVLDIGANVGVYSLSFAAKVGVTGAVHAFEPGAESLDRLRYNCTELNSSLPVAIWPVALSDTQGTQPLFHVGGALTTFSLGGSVDGPASETVDLTTLDSWSAAHHIDRVDIIKVDVEGHEPKVFEGGRHLLSRTRPLIMFEASSGALERGAKRVEDCWRPLEQLGYSMFRLDDGRLTPQDAPGDGNFYAIHPRSGWAALR